MVIHKWFFWFLKPITARLLLCLLFYGFHETFDFRRPKSRSSLAKLNKFQSKANKSVNSWARDFELCCDFFDRQ